MNVKKIIKKTASLIKKNVMNILLINLFIGYLTLFIVFIVVILDHRAASNSEWFLENFSLPVEPKARESKTLHLFYSKLLADQEALGKDFEKVLDENRWNLYES